MTPFLFTKILRRPILTFCSILTSAIFCFLICLLSDYVKRQKTELELVKDNFPIECVVSNVKGTSTKNLNIPSQYIMYVTKEQYLFSSYIKNLCMTKNFSYQWTDIERDNLGIMIGINQLECTKELSPEYNGKITFYDWYNEDFLKEEKAVCLVSTAIAQKIPIQEEENRFLNLFIHDPFLQIKKEITLQVVGEYESKSSELYIPWGYCYNLMLENSDTISCDSMSFLVKENRKLTELKKEALNMFVSIDPTEQTPSYHFALIIRDEIYFSTLLSLEQNAKRLERIMPLLLGLTLGIGGLISFLCVRTEKKSYALMRTLGVTGKKVFVASLSEQMVLEIIGEITGILFFLLTVSKGTSLPILFLILYFLCYFFGCCFAVYHITKSSPAQLLREEE